MLQQSQGTQLLLSLFASLWPSRLRTGVVQGAVSMFHYRPTLCIECAGHAFRVAILYHRQPVAGSSSDSQDLDLSPFPCAGLCFSLPSLLSMFPAVHVLPCVALWFEWRLCPNVSSTFKYSQKQHLHSFCMCRMLPLVAQCLLLCGPPCGELYCFLRGWQSVLAAAWQLSACTVVFAAMQDPLVLAVRVGRRTSM